MRVQSMSVFQCKNIIATSAGQTQLVSSCVCCYKGRSSTVATNAASWRLVKLAARLCRLAGSALVAGGKVLAA
jgi:hypothetical protein